MSEVGKIEIIPSWAGLTPMYNADGTLKLYEEE